MLADQYDGLGEHAFRQRGHGDQQVIGQGIHRAGTSGLRVALVTLGVTIPCKLESPSLSSPGSSSFSIPARRPYPPCSCSEYGGTGVGFKGRVPYVTPASHRRRNAFVQLRSGPCRRRGAAWGCELRGCCAGRRCRGDRQGIGGRGLNRGGRRRQIPETKSHWYAKRSREYCAARSGGNGLKGLARRRIVRAASSSAP